MEAERWRLEILGRVVACRGAETVDRFRDRRVLLILAVLSMEPHGTLPRAQLIERLWPGEESDAARNRFRVSLHHLRRQFESSPDAANSVIRATNTAVALAPGAVSCDAAEFAAAVRAADAVSDKEERAGCIERAVAIYQGDLLPEFEDAWVEETRAELSAAHFRALRDLARLLLELPGGPERAITYARRAVAAEPYDEEAHCDLIRACGGAGRFSEALRAYDALEALLDRDLGAKPSPSARRLAEMLRSRLGHGVKPAPSSSGDRQVPAGPLLSGETAGAMDPGDAAAPAPGAAPGPPVARREQDGAVLDQPRDASSGGARDSAHGRPAVRPRLPVPLTRFFGRAAELQALDALLAGPDRARLVTLIGPGGIGKSRLALEAAHRLAGRFAGRVYCVPLADVFAASQAPDSLVKALGQAPDPASDAISQALDTLAAGPTLLVLDNLEQLLPDLKDLILHLLEALPELQCLATSRSAVGVDGEHEVAVPPLDPPDRIDRSLSLDAAPSVALFLDRARAARHGFALTQRNRADVATLCATLGGLPLALELAGARAGTMTVREMCAEIDRMLEWLVDGRGSKGARHQSLRAAIQWSYRVLTPRLQRLLDSTGCFVGGFTVAAALALAGDPDESIADMRTSLQRLAAVSLIRAVEDDDGYTRFHLLDTIRAFALERLTLEGREEEARRRHLRWALDYAEESRADDGRRLAREEANVRAALDYGLAGPPDARDEAVRLALALVDHWRTRGSAAEGCACLERIVALDLPGQAAREAFAGLAALRIAVGEL
ncbi:MAG TPA: BTAD domain-containing putative transcriptional regulator, partial [Chthonomonadaceae bacterium]|nr:BTAD domain-containing putative transcriptional regulator [Chthonomonadaceae bacterium]